MQIGIIGLGLMGSSLALALKQHGLADEIVGYDSQVGHMEFASKNGIIDSETSFENLQEADFVFLAMPVDDILNSLPKLDRLNPQTTVIDFGSTKAQIVSEIPTSIRKQFIAAHPMAGTEKSGPQAAVKDLFQDKILVICNPEENDEFHLEKAKALFQKIGMSIIEMDAKQHDEDVAFISHLPHLMSFVLANTVLKQESPENIVELAGGGFRDMSRIAKSRSELWVEIFRQNQKNVMNSLNHFEDELKKVRQALEQNSWDDLDQLFTQANQLNKILK